MNNLKMKLHKKNSIHNSIKKNKIPLAIHLTRVQNPYSEDYKTLLKVIKENLNHWEVSMFMNLKA